MSIVWTKSDKSPTTSRCGYYNDEHGFVIRPCGSRGFFLLHHGEDVFGNAKTTLSECKAKAEQLAAEVAPDCPEYEESQPAYESCPDSPTGEHEFSVDVEYDSTGQTVNCEHCGALPSTAEVQPQLEYPVQTEHGPMLIAANSQSEAEEIARRDGHRVLNDSDLVQRCSKCGKDKPQNLFGLYFCAECSSDCETRDDYESVESLLTRKDFYDSVKEVRPMPSADRITDEYSYRFDGSPIPDAYNTPLHRQSNHDGYFGEEKDPLRPTCPVPLDFVWPSCPSAQITAYPDSLVVADQRGRLYTSPEMLIRTLPKGDARKLRKELRRKGFPGHASAPRRHAVTSR